MASIYQKVDPKGKHKSRWMAKVKVGRKWMAVSLRLLATPGTKKEAERRANQLQAEIQIGSLSLATLAWLGDESASKVDSSIRMESIGAPLLTFRDWESAGQGYLAANHARDTRRVPEGRAKVEERTKATRKYRIGIFTRWAAAAKMPFTPLGFSRAASLYLSHRRDAGIAASTLWGVELGHIVAFGNWLVAKKIIIGFDKSALIDALPRKPSSQFLLPSWREDLDNIRFFHAIRHACAGKSTLTIGTGPWYKLRSHEACWEIFLLVRGLGCRPSEATSVTWETVDLESGKVRFVHSKTDRNRTVPILLQWVEDGLKELWLQQGKPKTGSVCRNIYNRTWAMDSNVSRAFAKTYNDHGRVAIMPKTLEKLQIAQLVRMGFPPHVVAHWSDHSLSIQEKHYYEGDGYLPPEDGYDFGEFGVLSPFGQKVQSHHAGYSRVT